MSEPQFAKQTVKDEGNVFHRVIHEHDCFGSVVVSRSHGSPMTLFGSSLKHEATITVEVSRAHMERRSSYDRVSDVGEPGIVLFRMSETHWGQFVSSIGMGSGTPVTLEMAPSRDVQWSRMPPLALEPVGDVFKAEHQEALRKINENILQATAKINEMIAPGAKPPKKDDLKALLDLLRAGGEHFQANTKYMENAFTKTMESMVASAKAEVEAHVAHLISSKGLTGEDSKIVQIEG